MGMLSMIISTMMEINQYLSLPFASYQTLWFIRYVFGLSDSLLLISLFDALHILKLSPKQRIKLESNHLSASDQTIFLLSGSKGSEKETERIGKSTNAMIRRLQVSLLIVGSGCLGQWIGGKSVFLVQHLWISYFHSSSRNFLPLISTMLILRLFSLFLFFGSLFFSFSVHRSSLPSPSFSPSSSSSSSSSPSSDQVGFQTNALKERFGMWTERKNKIKSSSLMIKTFVMISGLCFGFLLSFCLSWWTLFSLHHV